MKVAVIVITYNLSAEIFILQIKAIRKFCKDDFVIEIFDNSSNEEKAEHIRYHAEQLEVNYYKTYSNSINSSDSHAFAAAFAYQKLKGDYSYFFFADHDLIPLQDFSVVDILSGGHVIAGLGQGAKKTYYWQGCVMFHLDGNDKDIIDFSPNGKYGLDTGGNLYKVIEKFGKENCIFFNEAYHENPYFHAIEYRHYATINNNMFLHIVNSSNWNGAERHEERINSMINVIKEKTGL